MALSIDSPCAFHMHMYAFTLVHWIGSLRLLAQHRQKCGRSSSRDAAMSSWAGQSTTVLFALERGGGRLALLTRWVEQEGVSGRYCSRSVRNCSHCHLLLLPEWTPISSMEIGSGGGFRRFLQHLVTSVEKCAYSIVIGPPQTYSHSSGSFAFRFHHQCSSFLL